MRKREREARGYIKRLTDWGSANTQETAVLAAGLMAGLRACEREGRGAPTSFDARLSQRIRDAILDAMSKAQETK